MNEETINRFKALEDRVEKLEGKKPVVTEAEAKAEAKAEAEAKAKGN